MESGICTAVPRNPVSLLLLQHGGIHTTDEEVESPDGVHNTYTLIPKKAF